MITLIGLDYRMWVSMELANAGRAICHWSDANGRLLSQWFNAWARDNTSICDVSIIQCIYGQIIMECLWWHQRYGMWISVYTFVCKPCCVVGYHQWWKNRIGRWVSNSAERLLKWEKRWSYFKMENAEYTLSK